MKNKYAILFLVLTLVLSSILITAGAATPGEENALKSARLYQSFMGFSKKGLTDQLLFDGYSQTEAQYAIENIGADWKENALKSAKNYMSFMSFSYSGLIDQLEFDGYTNEEARYAADILYERSQASAATPTPKADSTPVPKAPAATSPTETSVPQKIDTQFDFSSLSFTELLHLQKQLHTALMDSGEWQEVTVPPGVYSIGTDIPAGRWTIARAFNKYTYFRLGRNFEKGTVSGYTYNGSLDEPNNLIFEEGMYLEVLHASIKFTPYESGLGFTFK